jgi:hypothetical protein
MERSMKKAGVKNDQLFCWKLILQEKE